MQLYVFTLGDPTQQKDSLPAHSFMLGGLLGLHLGNRGGPQPAEVHNFPGETAPPPSSPPAAYFGWILDQMLSARFSCGWWEKWTEYFLLSHSRERYSSWNMGGLSLNVKISYKPFGTWLVTVVPLGMFDFLTLPLLPLRVRKWSHPGWRGWARCAGLFILWTLHPARATKWALQLPKDFIQWFIEFNGKRH